jgi:hypothetical protein
LRIAEESLDVTYLAETNLQYVEPNVTVRRARAWLTRNGFDAAPVREPNPHRFIALAGTEPPAARVGDVASPIDAEHLVTSTLSLADGVALLRDRPFFFVMDRRALVGIVTRADLQRPAVSMVVFSLVLAGEAAMNRIIEARLGPDWPDALGERARAELEALYKERVRTNTQITKLDCLLLSQRLRLLEKCPGAIGDLGFEDPGSFHRWKKTLLDLRNQLAHGGTLLGCAPEPVAAIDLFGEVRSFAERLWEIALRS